MSSSAAPLASSAAAFDQVDAVVFDTDGVITDTAQVHAATWKSVFDAYLRARSKAYGETFRPFDVRADYLRYVDGKPRNDGVSAFLAARRIVIPPDDRAEVIRRIARRKDALFLDQIRRYGVTAFSPTVVFVNELRHRRIATAAVSASRNCAEVLRRAGVAELFDVRVDGVDAARLGFPGKPHPGLFLEAARRLRVPPERTAVVEDALAGIIAGRRGGFGLVIGVDRGGHAAALREAGADLVFTDLAELRLGWSPHEPVAARLLPRGEDDPDRAAVKGHR
jgi:HAD superfamily hydrolase (TIGR01509 family)